MTDHRRGRPRQSHCYMNHPRIPENLTKSGGCKLCINDAKRVKTSKKNHRASKKIQKHSAYLLSLRKRAPRITTVKICRESDGPDPR